MRYYDIKITDKSGKLVLPPTGGVSKNSTYTSYVNGKTLSAALNVELDIPVAVYATPSGSGWVRIWGVSLKEVGQQNDLIGKTIAVSGGFQKGLPLANPSQNGLLARGLILQAFGNWVGTDMTLDLMMVPVLPPGIGDPPSTQPNIVLNWKKGQSLQDTLQQCLSTAFPGYTLDFRISNKLKLNQDNPSFHGDLVDLGQHVKAATVGLVDSDYPGVDFLIRDKKFIVFDGTTQKTPRDIAFKDLIGQPTWIDSPTIQFKTAMRADVVVGDFVKLPPGLVTTSRGVQGSQVDLKTAFNGSFLVQNIRHVGNFRQPSGDSWVSVFDAVPTKQQQVQQAA